MSNAHAIKVTLTQYIAYLVSLWHTRIYLKVVFKHIIFMSGSRLPDFYIEREPLISLEDLLIVLSKGQPFDCSCECKPDVIEEARNA
jgi:hypothetical protein